jgi:hypothetical protein
VSVSHRLEQTGKVGDGEREEEHAMGERRPRYSIRLTGNCHHDRCPRYMGNKSGLLL